MEYKFLKYINYDVLEEKSLYNKGFIKNNFLNDSAFHVSETSNFKQN